MKNSEERIDKVMKKRASQTDISKYFPKSWYKNIGKAIDVAVAHGACEPHEFNDMVDYIVEYNIDRTIKDYFLPNIVNSLPKEYDWRKKNAIDIFEDFKDIVDSCDICPNFKTYKATIHMPKNGAIHNVFLLWKEHVNTYYPHIIVTFDPTKNPGVYKLTLAKRSA